MRKNIFLIVLLATILVFVGAMNKGAKADVDPVEMIKNAKTPVYLHSLAGGDSLVLGLDSMVCTWWMSIYPSNTYPHVWHVIEERDTLDSGLSPYDKLKIEYMGPGSGTGSLWVDVLEVTKTLILTLAPLHEDTMYIEYTGGYDSLVNPATDPDYFPLGTWWHEIWPVYCPVYQIIEWIDNGDAFLSFCDTISFDGVDYWHVKDVAIDIEVHSIDPPDKIPSMTSWGLIILVVLLLASAVFIFLRKKKVMVSP